MNEVAEMSDDGSDISKLTDDESDDVESESEDELEEGTSKLDLDKGDDESDSESESASESDGSEAPPLAPASAYGGTNYTNRTFRTAAGKSVGGRSVQSSPGDDLRQAVTHDLAKQRIRTETKHHARKGLNTAGKAKGHKWKNSAANQVGKVGGGDGW
jgi:hypothetical protein